MPEKPGETDEIVREVESQIIDEQMDCLSRHELEGGWRSLCAMMLLRTANLLTCQMLSRKDFASQRKSAIDWIDGKNKGVITFSAACEGLGVDCETVRNRLIVYAEKRGQWPINKMGQPRHVFGKLHESPAENQAPSGVVARTQFRYRDHLCASG